MITETQKISAFSKPPRVAVCEFTLTQTLQDANFDWMDITCT